MLLSGGMSLNQPRVAQNQLADAAFHAVFVQRGMEVDEAIGSSGYRKASAFHYLVTVPTAMEARKIRIVVVPGRRIAGRDE